MSADGAHLPAVRTRMRYLVGIACGGILAVAGVMTFVPAGLASGGKAPGPLMIEAPELVTAPEPLRFSFRPQTVHGDPNAESSMVLQVVYRVAAGDRARARGAVETGLARTAAACAAKGRTWRFRELLAADAATEHAARLVPVVDRVLFAALRQAGDLTAEVIHLHVVEATPLQPGPTMTREQVQQRIQSAADQARRALESDVVPGESGSKEKKDG